MTVYVFMCTETGNSAFEKLPPEVVNSAFQQPAKSQLLIKSSNQRRMFGFME